VGDGIGSKSTEEWTGGAGRGEGELVNDFYLLQNDGGKRRGGREIRPAQVSCLVISGSTGEKKPYSARGTGLSEGAQKSSRAGEL